MRQRVYVVGGGPAGISAAIWAHRLGWEAVVVERRPTLGGQLGEISLPIPDLPGWPEVPASEVLERLSDHLARLGVAVELGVEAVAYDPARERLTFADGTTVVCRYLVYAPGLRVRRLGVPGEEALSDESVAAFLARMGSRPARCLVVGGGDRALEAAARLAEAGHPTVVVHRRDRFRARAQMRARLAASGAEVWWNTSVRAIAREEGAWAVALQQPGRRLTVRVDHVVVRIGMEPDWAPGIPVSDPEGRLAVAGDAAHEAPYRSLVTAFGSGMAAVRRLVEREERLS
ncbi:MAG: NAD(P)/FAD-dependent oxidoreductase [Firmicutes bacterium]|nr:NAD(P)/FAD-dependent oxidoreductase [Alicyclobacillaceae bacterium]MCL6496198.1 NAD(P)/FAD-dependent oxidoreductase [Bacillota bacterium]